MKFTEKQLEILKKAYENGETITIEGLNSIGDSFTTTGKIAVTDKKTIALYDDCVFLEWEGSRDFIAPFHTEHVTDDFDSSLYIGYIYSEKGELIYFNEDFDKIYDAVNLNFAEKHEEWVKEGRELAELDDVTAKLKELIGHPIEIDGYRGICLGPLCANNRGGSIGHLAVAVLVGSMFATPYSKLYTLDENGKLVKVADNSLSLKNFEIMENRRSKIFDCKNNEKDDME